MKPLIIAPLAALALGLTACAHHYAAEGAVAGGAAGALIGGTTGNTATGAAIGAAAGAVVGSLIRREGRCYRVDRRGREREVRCS